MPFTLVEETGSGVAGANSYATVSQADTYFESQIYKDQWIGASATRKAQSLAMATSTLDTLVAWNGTKKTSTNPLEWPRKGVTEKNGYAVADDIVPNIIKEATYLTALALLESNRREEPGDAGIDELTLEGIDIKFNKTDRSSILPHFVMLVVEDYGRIKGGRFASVSRS